MRRMIGKMTPIESDMFPLQKQPTTCFPQIINFSNFI